jgi:hypothetical protein
MVWSMAGKWLLCIGGKANLFYDFDMPYEREADCRLAVAAPALKAALEEILAANALESPYLMERARAVLDACEVKH